MIRQTVKRTLGRTIRRVLTQVRSLEAQNNGGFGEKPNQIDDPAGYEFAYIWLNSILRNLIAQEGKALRPNYTWGVLQGAHLAKAIGIDRVSVIEFGVAGGNGLVALEKAAEKVEQVLGVAVDVYGFDTGRGLPKPVDYRDCPNLWSQGIYRMDPDKLRKRLKRAHLVLGLVEKTLPQFLGSRHAPVAFISFDLDYYSSTMQAFKLLEAEPGQLLPRIFCYFDDIMGYTYSEFNGERLAIAEFNASHEMRKISPIYGLKYYLPPAYAHAEWSEQFFIAHIFNHDLYCAHDGLGGAAWGTDLKGT